MGTSTSGGQGVVEQPHHLPGDVQSRDGSSSAAAAAALGRDQREQVGRWGRSPPVKELEREMRRLLDGGRAGATVLVLPLLHATSTQRLQQHQPCVSPAVDVFALCLQCSRSLSSGASNARLAPRWTFD